MKALVLAGAFPQIALLKELKSRGITTVLADYNKEPIAKKYADIFYQESTQDPDMIEYIAKKEQVDFILTVCSEQALKTVALVSERLGLPCYVNHETVCRVTSKEYMKKVFDSIGIPNARHTILHGDDELQGDYNLPMIVKPADCSGSSGVRKVRTQQELEDAIADAKAMSRSKTVIVEEFVEGIEFSVDAFVCEGKANVLCISNSEKIAADDRFVIYRGNSPAIDDLDSVRPQVEEIAQKIATAFGLYNSPLLVQMIYSGGKLYVLEFSARTGGSAKYLLAKKSCGFDLVKAVVDITLGIRPDLSGIKGENKYVSNEYLYCRPGVFDHLEGFEELKEQGIISEYFQFKWQGAEVGDINHSGDRVAGFIVQADTKEEMNRKHNIAAASIRIIGADGTDLMRHELLGDLYPDAADKQ